MSYYGRSACGGRSSEAAAYVAGLMDSEKKSAFESHLAGCERCQAAMRRQKYLDTLTERLPRYRAPERPPRRRNRTRRLIIPGTAVAVLLLAFFALSRDDDRTQLLAAALAAEELTSIGDITSLSEREWSSEDVGMVPWLGFVTCSERIVQPGAGVYLCALDGEGPLGAAGVRAGEVIRSVDGRAVSDSRDLNERLVVKEIGATFRVGLERLDGLRHEVVVASVPFALGENHPFDMAWSPALREHVSTEDRLSPSNLFEPIGDSLAARLDVAGGVRVVRRLSLAEQEQSLLVGFPDLYGPRGLHAGHVIVAVNNEPVETVAELFFALAEGDDHDRPFTMTVHNLGGETSILSFGGQRMERDDPDAGLVTVRRDPLPDRLLAHAASFVAQGKALAGIWPGFFAPGSSFMIIDDSAQKTLLIHRTGQPQPPFTTLHERRVAGPLDGIAYYRDGYPEGLARGVYRPNYVFAGDTLPALPPKGSTLFHQRDFYFHEAFHGYQSRHFPPRGRRVRFGEHLVDPAFLDEDFRASAREERRILREALTAPYRERVFDLVNRYLDMRASRLEGKEPVEEVERDLERFEGTAQWVGCAAASLTTPPSDSAWMSVMECVDRELAMPLDEHSNFPEADARYMRWRLYGTGGALTLLIDRFGPADWRARVEAGEPLDRILIATVVRR